MGFLFGQEGEEDMKQINSRREKRCELLRQQKARGFKN